MIDSAMATSNYSTKNYVIQKFLVDEANRQNIDPALALAIAKVESDFNPSALSHAGAKGVMQIMPATAEGVFGISPDRLFDAKTNIELGIRFIKKLLSRYDQRIDIALSHYNGGSGVQNKYGGLTVIPATQKYVNKVLSAREHFKYKAYQLSDTPVKLSDMSAKKSLKNNLIKRVSIKEAKKPTFTLSKVVTAQGNVKNSVQKSKLTSSESFERSLYEKVEQLRILRLHNIMRNTKSHTLANNQKHLSDNKLVEPKVKRVFQNNMPLSEKRMKVLSWEKMFN
jgi:hypothetical protein